MLTIHDRDRDREFGVQVWSGLRHFGNERLPLVLSPLGEVDRARRVAEEAVSQALQMGHVVNLYFVRQVTAYFEMIRGDSGRATPR